MAAGTGVDSPLSIAEARNWLTHYSSLVFPAAAGVPPGSPSPLSTVTYRYLCVSNSSQVQTVLTKMPWKNNLHFALDYRMKWDYIGIKGRAQLKVLRDQW